MKSLIVRKKIKISKNNDPYIIAELGTNHNRDYNIAKKMINDLSKTKCNCIKFQIYEPFEIVSKNVKSSEYGLHKIYGNISAIKMFKKYLVTPKKWFPRLKNLCHALGLDFAITIHGENGLKWAKKMKPDLIKIASMDHTNIPFIKKIINNLNVPILVSVGMANLEDVKRLKKTLRKHKAGFGIFHCSSVYPSSKNEIRLNNISYLIKKLNLLTGFSDHTIGKISSGRARSLGATFFEKHVTLNKKLKGPDHPFALEIKHFNNFVKYVSRQKIKNLKKKFKFERIGRREEKNRFLYLKSIIVKKNLKIGDKINKNNIYFARPGNGIPPYKLEKILGLKVKKNFSAEDILDINFLTK